MLNNVYKVIKLLLKRFYYRNTDFLIFHTEQNIFLPTVQ